MCRKILWCYVFVLTLLDISLNTKLSAQGKSHGVTVHDSLIEGITFQEWGAESGAAGAGRGGGRAVAAGAVSLSPPALQFGRVALAAAHALTVTLTNTANTTMHLASVAGTTPDFHASFFESKTLPPQANTTFSVVYLGRREGPVAAHLYIHTSLGVHKYPVSAEGVASEWGVWPLVGVRVPLNATVEPLLTLHNPTDHTIQVSEVYSSGAWLGLVLPGGGAAAPRAVWSVPPRARRPLVRLRLAPPAALHAAPHPLTAYIRIKANITGGGLVVCVEARSVPAGEYVSPLQLRLRTRGSDDPPDVFDIAAGNSAAAGVALEAGVWEARCAATPPSPPPPPTPADNAPPTANGQSDKGTANGNGVKSDGVYISLLQPQLEPHQQLTRAAQLTLDYAAMWAGQAGQAGGEGGAWCAGWVRVGRAALPYSVRVLPGTLRLAPDKLHFVTSNREDALRAREVRVRNEFPVPVHIAHIDVGPEVDKYFEVESLCPVRVGAGGAALVARVRPRPAPGPAPRPAPGPAPRPAPGPAPRPAPGPAPRTLRTHLTLRTNLTDYTLPLLAYSGELDIEWEWPNSADGTLRLGAVGTSSTRRVGLTLRNAAPAALCVTEHALQLPGASLALQPCAHLRPPPPGDACRCIPAGGSARAWLTVVAPAREGELSGELTLWARAADGAAPAAPAATRQALQLHAYAGRVHVLPLQLPRAAPYAWASAPLILENTMSLQMRVVSVTLPPDDPSLFYDAAESGGEVGAGRQTVGRLVFAPERLCAPACYTGLDADSAEGAAWAARAGRAALAGDAALWAARRARWAGWARAPHNVSLHVHTSRAVQLAARGAARAHWPRLAARHAPAPLSAVAAPAPLLLRVRNPSASHALLLQPVLAGPLPELAGETAEAGSEEGPADAAAACGDSPCLWDEHAFALQHWRPVLGAVRPHGPAGEPAGGPAGGPAAQRALPLLLLPPGAELELTLSFTPAEAAAHAAYLYLRNNLTILEAVLLTGHGAHPSFELGGRRPGSNAPLVFEVTECGATVRRTLLARNTGRVRVQLRDWRVAGQPCQARGFRLTPCAPLALAPNESRALTLAFTPDYSLARVGAELSARTAAARAAFVLRAAAPARLLPRCARAAPRPPWEPAARAAAALLALAALALVLAAAALDAERELRRARAARPPPPPAPAARRPLDLRALAQHAPAPPPRRPPPRRRRPRPDPPPDPAAERQAFERWRADVLARAPDQSRPAPDRPSADPPAAADGYEADPETEDRPQGSGDDDAVSTGSGSASASSSSPTVDDHDEADECDEPEREPPRESPALTASDESPPTEASQTNDTNSPAELAPRPLRARREAGDTPRRPARPAEPADGGREPRPRPAGAKHHARKEKPSKRLRSRPAASPPREAPRAERAPGSLRWGASWSSVVAAGAAAPGAPLAPIGSDVRRRPEPERAPPATDHSLFYFNGDAAHSTHACRDADFSWRPPPPVERPAFTPARDFLDEPVSSVGAVGSGSFRSLSSVWGSPAPALEAAWLWGTYDATVRPPPGFGAPRPVRPYSNHQESPVRPYDPFRSLASIWAPGALDWRSEPAPGPAGPAPGPAPAGPAPAPGAAPDDTRE